MRSDHNKSKKTAKHAKSAKEDRVATKSTKRHKNSFSFLFVFFVAICLGVLRGLGGFIGSTKLRDAAQDRPKLRQLPDFQKAAHRTPQPKRDLFEKTSGFLKSPRAIFGKISYFCKQPRVIFGKTSRFLNFEPTMTSLQPRTSRPPSVIPITAGLTGITVLNQCDFPRAIRRIQQFQPLPRSQGDTPAPAVS